MSMKRRVLSALGKAELLAIGERLELDVTTRMTVDDLTDALAASRRATLASIVDESLSRDTLKAICTACGLDDTGREKSALIERILATGDKDPTGSRYKIDAAAAKGSMAGEGSVPLVALLPGLDGGAARKSTKAKGKSKAPERRRAGVPESESVVSGSLKAALRQFALGAAGGYKGREVLAAPRIRRFPDRAWRAGPRDPRNPGPGSGVIRQPS